MHRPPHLYNPIFMKKPSNAVEISINDEPSIPTKAEVTDLASYRHNQAQTRLRCERVVVNPDLVGSLYSLNGKRYIFNIKESVFDCETGAEVADPGIRDQVIDLHRQDQALSEAIALRAKRESHGDESLEEALRLHYSIAGLTESPQFVRVQNLS